MRWVALYTAVRAIAAVLSGAFLIACAVQFSGILRHFEFPVWVPEISWDPSWGAVFTAFSILIATLGAPVRFLRYWDLRKVFGNALLEEDYGISVPEFHTSAEAETVLNEAGLTNSRKRFSPANVSAQYRAGDIRRIIASSDLEGASYMIDEIGRYSKRSPKLKPGVRMFGDHRSVFAFGLQTNPHTPEFLQALNRHSAQKIKINKKARFDSEEITINKLLKMEYFGGVEMEPVKDGYSADIVFKDTNLGDIRVSQDHDDVWNVGLIVILKHHDTGRDGRQVLCAGVGHGGTAGSAYWLSKHWRDLTSSMQGGRVQAVLALTATRMQQFDPNGSNSEHKAPMVTQTRLLSRATLKH